MFINGIIKINVHRLNTFELVRVVEKLLEQFDSFEIGKGKSTQNKFLCNDNIGNPFMTYKAFQKYRMVLI